MVDPESIVAKGFLSMSNLHAIRRNLERIYPLDETPCFRELLGALDQAKRKLRAGKQ